MNWVSVGLLTSYTAIKSFCVIWFGGDAEIKGGKWEEKESANSTEGPLYFITE